MKNNLLFRQLYEKVFPNQNNMFLLLVSKLKGGIFYEKVLMALAFLST